MAITHLLLYYCHKHVPIKLIFQFYITNELYNSIIIMHSEEHEHENTGDTGDAWEMGHTGDNTNNKLIHDDIHDDNNDIHKIDTINDDTNNGWTEERIKTLRNLKLSLSKASFI